MRENKINMEIENLIGTIGVSLLLIAFFLNLFKILKVEHPAYILLNLFGAGIACYASVLIGFMPFVILEGTWAVVALVALMRPVLKKN